MAELDTSLKRQSYPIYEYEGYKVIYIYDEILSPNEVVDVVEVIERAAEGSTIYLKINSIGGYIASALAIIDAINNSSATVIAVLSGQSASAATMIALASHDLVVNPDATFMIHSVSYGAGGKLHEVGANIAFNNKTLTKFIKKIYKKFLTKKQIKAILNGQELYLNADEIKKGWERVVKHRQKQVGTIYRHKRHSNK